MASRAGGYRVPHTRVRHGPEGLSGAPRRLCGTPEGGGAPAISHRVRPDGGMWAHGCRGLYTRCRTTSGRTPSDRSAGIDQGAVGGPQAHDNAPRCAPGRPAGHARWWGAGRWRLGMAGVGLDDQQADGSGRDGTAGLEHAARAAVPEAIGEDVREAPAEQRHDVEGGGARARTAHVPGRAGDGAVRERTDAAGGDGDREDRGGEVLAGRVAVGVGLAVDVPVGVPDQGVDLRPQSSVVHIFFQERAVNGCKGFHGDRAVGAGGAPCRAVLCEATAGHHGVDGRMVLERSSPGRADAGKAGEAGADAALLVSAPFEGVSRGGAHGRRGEAVRRAAQGAQGPCR